MALFSIKKDTKTKAESNKDIARNANKISVFFGIAATVLSLAALIVSVYSLFLQNATSDYERVFQPTIYSYTIDADSSMLQSFEGYAVPTVNCQVDLHSGFPKQVATINCDGTIESIYSYSSKIGVKPRTDLTLKFTLPFSSLMTYNGITYQYIFIYIEGADSTWYLDCIVLSYDLASGTSEAVILDKLDLLRFDFETNKAYIKILEEYQALYTSISELEL